MSQIEVCYLRDSEDCDFQSCVDCGYYKLVVESANSLQQLKAEIRSVVDDFVCIPPVRIAHEIDNLIYKLRELSRLAEHCAQSVYATKEACDGVEKTVCQWSNKTI